jgi:hypothetical protein
MFSYKKFINWSEEVIQKTGFEKEKIIYQGYYYSKNYLRKLIFAGSYKAKKSVLSLYFDPRPSDEPLAQIEFNKNNQSKILKAPQVYDFKILSQNQGWILMEKLPKGGEFFSSPLNQKQKEEFLKLFLEYRKNFPKKSQRPLIYLEQLSAGQFHLARIYKWFRMASDKMVNFKDKKLKFDFKRFYPLFDQVLNLIEQEFKQREKIWCHGHFKPQEIYKINSNNYYLTDFAHRAYYPEGYELAFIIWSDWLLGSDYNLDYFKFKKGIINWIEKLKPIAKQLKIKNFDSLIKASLAERILGTIFADLIASDKITKEKNARIEKLERYLGELIA